MNVPFYEERKAEFEKLNPEGEALTEWKYQAYMQDYLACIKGIDRQVGRLLDYLEKNDMLENTLIGYSSDQGFYLGEHGWFDKRFMYEESFRTPLILAWPGQIEPGSVNTDLVQNIDMAPTFLELAGMEVPETMQGRSLLPLFDPETKPADWRQSLYYHYYEYPGAHSVRKHEGAFDGRYKLIRFYGRDVPGEEEWELYDLEKDPLEVHNVVNDPDYQGTREKMEQELRRLQKLYEVPQG
jgi:arylsulfatase A-like enzyme